MKSLAILLSMSLATVKGLPAGEPPAKAKVAATDQHANRQEGRPQSQQ